MSFGSLLPFADVAILWFAHVDAFFGVHEILPERQLRLLFCDMPQHLVHVRLTVRTSNHIDTPPVNPMLFKNRDISLPVWD